MDEVSSRRQSSDGRQEQDESNNKFMPYFVHKEERSSHLGIPWLSNLAHSFPFLHNSSPPWAPHPSSR